MSIPTKQNLRIARYVLQQQINRQEKYPLVVELEPLFACNLNCPGCGKTDQPPEVLAKQMTVDEAVDGVLESKAPLVAIAGGEPLLHHDIGGMVHALIARGVSVYLCTNGLLLRRKLSLFRPSPYFSWVVHLDGVGERHDRTVGRHGVFDEAVAGIAEAKAQGFRMTTNSTFFSTDSSQSVVDLLDFLCLDLGVDAVMISPAYAQEGASHRDRFPAMEETQRLFGEILEGGRRRRWRFNHSPLYLDFLAGGIDLQCMPWAIPSFSVLGWQRPCYMLADSYAQSYRELLETTDWSAYGRGHDPRCSDCMAHSGYEPSAVLTMMRSPLCALRSRLRR